jgi:hypothetical protein
VGGKGGGDGQARLAVRIDWGKVPSGRTEVPIVISGSDGTNVVVTAPVERPALPPSEVRGFVEAGGYIAWDADAFRRQVPANGLRWTVIEGIGRTGNAVKPFPSVAPRQAPGAGPRLEYDITVTNPGDAVLWTYLSPRNNVLPTDGLTYAVSVDGGAPQTVNVTARSGADDGRLNRQWAYNTSDNVTRMSVPVRFERAGRHTVTLWMVDPTVVVQKFVLVTNPDEGDLRWTYLGPQTSARRP